MLSDCHLTNILRNLQFSCTVNFVFIWYLVGTGLCKQPKTSLTDRISFMTAKVQANQYILRILKRNSSQRIQLSSYINPSTTQHNLFYLKPWFIPLSKHSPPLLQLDRQYTYNVTMRCNRATIVAMESKKYSDILSMCL